MAQDAKKLPEPEYIGVVLCLDPAGVLTPLERQQAQATAKVKGGGFGGVQSSTSYKGAKSPVRFKVGQEVNFVVRLNAPEIEPDSLVNLDVLKVSKTERGIITLTGGGFAGSVKTRTGETLRALTFKKYGESSTRFSQPNPWNRVNTLSP